MRRRREFLQQFGMPSMSNCGQLGGAPPRSVELDSRPMAQDSSSTTRAVTLFLCGDVMIGRGIDQILAHPSKPRLYEDYVTSAEDYVGMAESHFAIETRTHFVLSKHIIDRKAVRHWFNVRYIDLVQSLYVLQYMS